MLYSSPCLMYFTFTIHARIHLFLCLHLQTSVFEEVVTWCGEITLLLEKEISVSNAELDWIEYSMWIMSKFDLTTYNSN